MPLKIITGTLLMLVVAARLSAEPAARQQRPTRQKPDHHLAKVVKRVIRHSHDHREKGYAKRRTSHSSATGGNGAGNNGLSGRPATTGVQTVDETSNLHLSADFKKHRGQLSWPVSGMISMAFGPHEYMGNKLRHNNVGITVDAAEGTVVKAVYQGEVTSIEDIGGVWCVIMRHGKYYSAYSNLASTTVVKGQRISSGESLGLLGDTGQLEFLLMNENGEYVDPEKWLKK
ncbi:MAG TPA: peptidoglycan DD-metalloendopeptidase family protein [Puia sp.]|jgi:septal ring factor EnvC (AmiA/AmiB activator)